MQNLNVSIVLYKTSKKEIDELIVTLLECKAINRVFLIDNSPTVNSYLTSLGNERIEYYFCNSNKGYGTGHNIAIRKSLSEEMEYHLVMNSDLSCSSKTIDSLVKGLEFLPEVGLAAPKVLDECGVEQRLKKFIPSPFDLIKRLINTFVKIDFKDSLLMSVPDGKKIVSVPYMSGCFMLFRVSALRGVGIFDERFFLYPEDMDLSRRIYRLFDCCVFQKLTIKHNHAGASKRNLKLFLIHIYNIVIYFNKWGWVFDSERIELNKRAREKLRQNS